MYKEGDDSGPAGVHVAPMSELRDLLVRAANEIADYREGAARDRVFPDLDPASLRAAFGGPLPDQLRAADGVEVLNDVVLNQVVRFGIGPDADRDATTDRVIAAVQEGGECWMGATTWHGVRLMRISVSNWTTTEADVDRSVAAILAATRVARVA